MNSAKIQIMDNGGSLRIANVSEADAGAYECVAYSIYGEERASCMLDVLPKEEETIYEGDLGFDEYNVAYEAAELQDDKSIDIAHSQTGNWNKTKNIQIIVL